MRMKKISRKMTDRLKRSVSALLVSSMVLNPLNGIQIAVGSEQDQTRMDISGIINKKVNINLDSEALKTAALAAIQEGNVYSVGNYLSTDTATDAAFENLMNEENPFYELQLWSGEEEALMAENGIDVKLLVQRDSRIVKEEKEDTDAPATKSQLRKSNVSFKYDAHDAKPGQEIAFYQPGSSLDSLLSEFQADKLYHETVAAENSLDNSTYELTGDETLTVLYMNTDKKAHTFKLSVDGKTYSTGIKVAGTEKLAKAILKKLKSRIKEDLTGTTEAADGRASDSVIRQTETEDNAVISDASTAAETTERATEAEDNVVASTTETTVEAAESAAEAESTQESTEESTEAATTAAAESEAEVTSQAESTAKETENSKTSEAAESAAETERTEESRETAIREVEQSSGESTITRIGAFTLDRFFDEAASVDVKTAEQEDESTAAETTLDKEESTATETKAITAMDESLAAERQETLKTVSTKDIATELTSAKLVQYTLADITSDFKSADLGAYLVKVYPVDEGAIDSSWTLKATELLKEEQTEADASTESPETMKTETAEVLKEAGIYENSTSLDIHFEDADGNEVEPNGKVKVEIEVAKEILDAQNATSLNVYHVEEKTDGSVKEVKALDTNTKALDQTGTVIADSKAIVTETVENTEAIAAVAETEEENTTETTATETVTKFSEEVAKVKTEFTVESFSTFTIQWGQSGQTIQISRYDIDTNQELTDSSDADILWRAKDIDLTTTRVPAEYEFVKALYNSKEIDSTLLWQGQDGDQDHDNGYYQIRYKDGTTVTLASGAEINVYYKKMETVETLDSTSKGVTMYLYDYPDGGNHIGLNMLQFVDENGKDLKDGAGLLQNDLNTDGYPSTNKKAKNKPKDSYTDALNLKSMFATSASGGNTVATTIKKVNHLFYQSSYDNGGWFEYDSAKNFASIIDESTAAVQTDGNFTVYKNIAGPNTARDSNVAGALKGNFFPFNTIGGITDVTDENGQIIYQLNTLTKNKQGVITSTESKGGNVHFGMMIETTFYQPVGGKLNGEDMIFEFSGDDDMWVYIDDRLVLDLGGIHASASGSINFATGDVVMNRYGKTSTSTTIRTQMEISPQKTNLLKTGKNTFADGTQHSMKIFYLERGESLSDLKIKFNTPSAPKGALVVNKTVTGEEVNYSTSQEFTMKLEKKTSDGKYEAVANQAYSLLNQSTGGGTTREDGTFKLKATESAVFGNLEKDDVYRVTEVLTEEQKKLYKESYSVIKDVNGTVTEIANTNETTISSTDTETIKVTNTWQRANALTVSKTVTGDAAEINKAFTFKLDLSGNDSSKIASIKKLNEGRTDLTWEQTSDSTTENPKYTGVVIFTITPDKWEEAKFDDGIKLLSGTKYQLYEKAETGYVTYVEGKQKTAENDWIKAFDSTQTFSEAKTIAFTNHKDMPSPTGVHKDILPYVIGMGIALAGVALLLLENERRKRLNG